MPRVFEYGWSEDQDPHERLWLRFNAVGRAPLAWKDEFKASARKIAGTATRPLWVCASSGFLSEAVCRAFFDLGIHFSVLTIEFADGVNAFDTRSIRAWCVRRGVVHDVVELDCKQLLTQDMDRYREAGYEIHTPYRCIELKLLELVEARGGCAILGGGKIPFKIQSTAEEVGLQYQSAAVASAEWCRRNSGQHVTDFFLSTPELALSYLSEHLIQGALHEPRTIAVGNHAITLRRILLEAAWPDIRARRHRTGFEKVRPLVREMRERFALDTKRTVPGFIPMNDVLTQLRGEVITK